MIEQGSIEWRRERAGHITSSRADDLMSEPRTKGQEAAGWRNLRALLVCERLTGEPADDVFVSDAMRRGTEKEPSARSWYGDQKDALVTQLGFRKHPTIPWVGASVDGEVEEGVGGLEIKAPNSATHIETLLNGTMRYSNQVQQQMLVMGWAWVDFVSFDDRLPKKLWGCIYRIERDDALIAKIESKCLQMNLEVGRLMDKLNAV